MKKIVLDEGMSVFEHLVMEKVTRILGSYVQAAVNEDLEGAVAYADSTPDIPTNDPGAVDGLKAFVKASDRVLEGVEAWIVWINHQRQIAKKFIAEQETT